MSDPPNAQVPSLEALTHDPYNEYLYVRVMRLQAAAATALGPSAAPWHCWNHASPTSASLPSAQVRQAAAALLAGPGPGPGEGDTWGEAGSAPRRSDVPAWQPALSSGGRGPASWQTVCCRPTAAP